MLDISTYKLTGWRPDTCKCSFKLCWDGTKLDDGNLRVVVTEATACPDHQASTIDEVYALATAHNAAVNEQRRLEAEAAGE